MTVPSPSADRYTGGRLASLTTRDFRNLAAVDVQFPEDGVVILGANGQGKTNVLEAIYYLVLFRSLRGAKDRELVRFGTDGFFVAGNVPARVTVGFDAARARKKVTVDGREIGRLADGIGQVVAVALSPDDRTMVSGGPAGRRRYLDVLLSLGTPSYITHLSAMRHALKQRNAALRRGRERDARAFDQPFADAAAAVARARRAWIAAWRTRYAELCAALGESAEARLEYRPDHRRESDAPEDLQRTLGEAADRDLRRGTTTVGPHRDDLALTLGGRDLRRYGSAGQQRTAAVALRLLEAETLRERHGTPPIGLYDDVFAELDRGRQERLLALIRHTLPGQAILTAPRESEVPDALLQLPRWSIAAGRIET